MKEQQRQVAQQCNKGVGNNTMDFPDVVMQLIHAGFDRYLVDFCKSTITYYLPCGDNLTLESLHEEISIPVTFDVDHIRQAILAAQMKAENYSYAWFCKKAMEAGCAGYIVSLLGKRVVYFGRTGETYVEHFPK